MTESLVNLPVERSEQTIFVIRGERVMLDRDLAALSGASTKALNLRRNSGTDDAPDLQAKGNWISCDFRERQTIMTAAGSSRNAPWRSQRRIADFDHTLSKRIS